MRKSTIVAAAVLLATGVLAQQGAGYHVARTLAVGGEGGWDYLTVDTVGHRLYLSRGTHVMVVDLDRDTLAGDIPNTPGVHGIAVAPELGKGFTSNGRDSTVTVFDLKTLAVTATIRGTGRNPDAILYEPVTKRVFTFNGGSANATAIDARTNAVLGVVPLGGKPEFARGDGTGRVFVNVEDRHEIVAFDARTLAVQAHWDIAPCEDPTGLAIDRARRRLFAVCGNKLMAVVDAASGKVVATVPIGAGSDGAAFDPERRLVFSSNGEGTLTVVREEAPDRYAVAETVPTAARARTVTIDERTHRVYTVTARFGPTPAATAEQPRPRPPMLPGSFAVLVVER